jgi:hypothetical protein
MKRAADTFVTRALGASALPASVFMVFLRCFSGGMSIFIFNHMKLSVILRKSMKTLDCKANLTYLT